MRVPVQGTACISVIVDDLFETTLRVFRMKLVSPCNGLLPKLPRVPTVPSCSEKMNVDVNITKDIILNEYLQKRKIPLVKSHLDQQTQPMTRVSQSKSLFLIDEVVPRNCKLSLLASLFMSFQDLSLFSLIHRQGVHFGSSLFR